MYFSINITRLTHCSVSLVIDRFAPGTHRFIQLLLLLLVLLAAGCSSLPGDYTAIESTALQDYQSTTVGQRFATEEAQHPGKSGFTIIRYGRNAFSVRIAMTQLAEQTLDLQYYIWESDETGLILAEHLVRAADRGVRVRLLVDDMGIDAEDVAIASMDAHPNIEISIFNPFANRKAKMFDFITDMGRVNHRMHNKIMVMDNSFAIVGGRNIGDHYFSVNSDTNFRDLDIAAVGPVVREISNVFDHFWNGEWSVPIAAFIERPYTQTDLDTLLIQVRKKIAAGDYPYAVDEDIAYVRAEIAKVDNLLTWAPGQVVWDDPESIKTTGKADETVSALRRKIDTVERTLTIESAYFVVGNRGIETTKKLIDKGIKVRIMTNSLASNDVLAAHAGHAKYRKKLLQAGAEIYELRPDSEVIKKTWVGRSMAGLHTKALVFDAESLFIGSFNVDPRSANINTEAGLYVESPELAVQLLAYLDEGILPMNSYRLLLDKNGDLIWASEEEGARIEYDKDPKSTFWQRFTSGFIGILPVESQL